VIDVAGVQSLHEGLTLTAIPHGQRSEKGPTWRHPTAVSGLHLAEPCSCDEVDKIQCAPLTES
jgi:hypothetical protein